VTAPGLYQHVPPGDLPLALARLHAALRTGARVAIILADLRQMKSTPNELGRGRGERRLREGEVPGRLLMLHTHERMRALVEGAGFENVVIKPVRKTCALAVHARRARSLPDFVGPKMRLLVCGLNPSLYSADVGVPFARPGNRFWAAARAAGLVVNERDPLDAFRRGVGMTDLVKRASASASEVSKTEYMDGLRRVEALVRLYQPGATCFVGLDGWRRAVDPGAQSGWITGGFGSRPAYLMPSTSGRNARVRPDELAAHLRRAAGRR